MCEAVQLVPTYILPIGLQCFLLWHLFRLVQRQHVLIRRMWLCVSVVSHAERQGSLHSDQLHGFYCGGVHSENNLDCRHWVAAGGNLLVASASSSVSSKQNTYYISYLYACVWCCIHAVLDLISHSNWQINIFVCQTCLPSFTKSLGSHVNVSRQHQSRWCVQHQCYRPAQ